MNRFYFLGLYFELVLKWLPYIWLEVWDSLEISVEKNPDIQW